MAKNLVLGPKTFFVDFTSTRCYTLLQATLYRLSRKTNEINLRKGPKKPSFGSDFGSFGPNLEPKNFYR